MLTRIRNNIEYVWHGQESFWKVFLLWGVLGNAIWAVIYFGGREIPVPHEVALYLKQYQSMEYFFVVYLFGMFVYYPFTLISMLKISRNYLRYFIPCVIIILFGIIASLPAIITAFFYLESYWHSLWLG